MKRSVILLLLTLLCSFSAQGIRAPKTQPNYDLASQFSAKRISQMVFSTSIQPNWFRDSDKFWYSWKTPAGTEYWIVDPEKGSKTRAFDMEKLAMQITERVRDPFDAQHLPIENLRLRTTNTSSSTSGARRRWSTPWRRSARSATGRRATRPRRARRSRP